MLQTPLNQRGSADSASNTSQYSGSGGGSQPPTGGKLLPCCFAFLVGCRWVTCKARNTPMLWHAYRECDSAFGQTMFKLQREHCTDARRPGRAVWVSEFADQ